MAGAVADASPAQARLRALCLAAATAIRDECVAASTHEDDEDDGGGLAGCGEPCVLLLSRQASRLLALYDDDNDIKDNKTPAAQTKKDDSSLAKRLNDLLSIAYTKFYAYLYKDLPTCWRQLYTDAAILKFSCLLLRAACANVADAAAVHLLVEEDALQDMVRTLDLALILAGAAGDARGRSWIDQAFALLEECTTTTTINAKPAASIPDEEQQRPIKRVKLAADDDDGDHHHHNNSPCFFSTHEPFTPPVRHPIPRRDNMDMPAFQHYLDHSPETGPAPLILTGLVDHWPARRERPWSSPAYLLSRTFDGRRLVPVELGRSYVDQDWGQKIVPFGDFLRNYIDPLSPTTATTATTPSKKEIAYLAQHNLFLQLPQLRNDILLPDHCFTTPPPPPQQQEQEQIQELDEPLLNAWLGPPGTITPLHTDPYHNLLVQVVGRKYVRLYAPQQTARMHARGKEGAVDMCNTSLLDVGVLEGWDEVPEEEEEDDMDQEDNMDEFKAIPFVDCILEPGDTLYIPVGWWHYVRGLSVSFSVSIWWN